MQIAVRSTYMAGVALVGAGVIAAAPLAPPMPDIHLPAVPVGAVELAAQVNPIAQWGQVITGALQNTKELAAGVLADPAPVLGQVVKNEVASAVTLAGSVRDFLGAAVTQLGQTPEMIRQALGQLAAGQITDGLITLYQAAIFPLIVPILNTNLLPDIQAAVRKPVQNMVNVIDTALTSPTGTGWVLAAGFPLIQVSTDLVSATGDSIQAVLSAVKSGNLGAALGAILSIPATLTGALLNGYADDGAGLLGPNGVVQGLRNALHIIAAAIKPATAPVSTVESSDPVKVVTVTSVHKDEHVVVEQKVTVGTAVSPEAVAASVAPVAASAASAAQAATDDTADVSATKADRRAAHRAKKSSDADATVVSTSATTGTGDGATAPALKSARNAKKDRTGTRSGAGSASASGRNAHHSHGSTKGGRG